jgi:molybdate/tungstate transport system substrate-binding protein
MGQNGGMSRRRALAVGASVATSLAGCLAAGSSGSGAVSLLAAGSLNNALENGLRSALDAPLEVEAYGSAQAARLVADGQKDPDIVSLADVSLFDGPLHPDWYAAFATNSLVVAYDPDSAGGKRLARAGEDDWFRPVLSGKTSLGRTDPDLDPLGYRTLFMLELATEYYDTEQDLSTALLSPDQVYPETQLVSQFETGSVDAAITYRSMAVERDYAFIDLPSQLDLSDPAYAQAYRSTTYTLPDGKVVRGGVITYGSTIRSDRLTDALTTVFDAHTTGSYLREFGFSVPDEFPHFSGHVPARLTS